MTTADHITRILTDGKPRTDIELHDQMKREGFVVTYQNLQNARRKLQREIVVIPAVGHAKQDAFRGSVLQRFKLTDEAIMRRQKM